MQKVRGFTLVEILVGLAILGILMSLGFSQLKPPAARMLAGSVKTTIQQARFEAIKRNRAVAVVFYDNRIETRVNRNSQDKSCDNAATELLRKLDINAYGPAKVSQKNSDAPPVSLYWLPSGQVRRCTTNGFYAYSVAVSLGNSIYHVVTNQGARTKLVKVN